MPDSTDSSLLTGVERCWAAQIRQLFLGPGISHAEAVVEVRCRRLKQHEAWFCAPLAWNLSCVLCDFAGWHLIKFTNQLSFSWLPNLGWSWQDCNTRPRQFWWLCGYKPTVSGVIFPYWPFQGHSLPAKDMGQAPPNSSGKVGSTLRHIMSNYHSRLPPG